MTSEAVRAVKSITAITTLVVAVAGAAYAMGSVPDSGEIESLEVRLQSVEIFEATTRADISAIRESLKRIEGIQ